MKRIVMAMLVLGASVAACDDDDDPAGPQTEEFRATLSGAAERPTPVTTSASGSATVKYDPASGTFSYTLNASSITGVTAAHIHGPATTEQAAGVLVPLTAPNTGAAVSGTFTNPSVAAVSPDSLLKLMRGGLTYVNVHTAANPAGHIRGQLSLQ